MTLIIILSREKLTECSKFILIKQKFSYIHLKFYRFLFYFTLLSKKIYHPFFTHNLMTR